MVTPDIIKALFKGVVTAHRVGVSWASEWTPALDADHSQSYPVCIWNVPPSGVALIPSGNGQQSAHDLFGIVVAFKEKTDTDRLPEERDQAHHRMEVIARQCFYRFRELYVLDSSTYQGETIDLKIETAPVFEALWDQAGTMTTGTTMSFVVRNNIPTPCVDGYFS
jgi:hypothetical protein